MKDFIIGVTKNMLLGLYALAIAFLVSIWLALPTIVKAF